MVGIVQRASDKSYSQRKGLNIKTTTFSQNWSVKPQYGCPENDPWENEGEIKNLTVDELWGQNL